MKLRAKVFLEDKGSYVFGPGRASLLELTRSLGSLNQAAREVGMSYRWAWGRIRDAEKALGVPLLRVEKHSGGRARILTKEAEALLAWYDDVSARMEEVLNQALESCPSFLPVSTGSDSFTEPEDK